MWKTKPETLNLTGFHRPVPMTRLKYWFDNTQVSRKTLVCFTDWDFCKEVEMFCSVNNIEIHKKGFLNGIVYCYLKF